MGSNEKNKKSFITETAFCLEKHAKPNKKLTLYPILCCYDIQNVREKSARTDWLEDRQHWEG